MSIKCKIESVKPLTINTYQILLIPETAIAYQAGQYLLALIKENDKRPFSIASSPCRQNGREIELHIGAANHNPYALEVVEVAKLAQEKGDYCFEIEAPCGNAWFREKRYRPILLIAGGTGFSYVRSILDHCLTQNINQSIFLYWGARKIEHLYATNELEALALQTANLTYIPVLENAQDNWQGKKGNVLEAVMDDFVSLSAYDIYIAGRFDMSGIARDMFCEQRGAQMDNLFSDAFEFI